ncbi:MAG TPA: NAD(P)H-hydrate dehydratase [Cytophagaceae bacterium]|nr:NAD(P)H-hydrate dehydratase [Cytophagaceae bacterium]
MKILNAAQIKELDNYTILNEPIESINLMERAATAFVRWFTERFRKEQKVVIFCGPGDNGADGLAIARMLIQKMYEVTIYHVKTKETSENYQTNEERLSHVGFVKLISAFKEIPPLSSNLVIIDALFGSGTNKPIEGLHADVINAINKSEATIVAVDMPSGLYMDKQNENPIIIKALYTVSFQLPKLAFMLPQHQDYVGQWYILHIGLSRDYIEKAETNYYYLDEQVIKSMVHKRAKFSHKGTYGKALLITGSYGMLGASVLTSKACLRTGAGLVKVYVPEAGFFVLQNDLPEVIVLTDPHPEMITNIPDLSEYDSIGIGPGMGEKAETVAAFEKLLTNTKAPLVIDASALNMLAAQKTLLDKIPAGSILTPHPKEFERLAGKSTNDYDRLEKAKAFCKKYKVILVLKGAHTAVINVDGTIYFNSTGNPGMATAGSGDVLTGVITSLLAQKYNSLEAAQLGVFLHGYAGDAAARKLSQQSMLASDIIEGITHFYKDFHRN